MELKLEEKLGAACNDEFAESGPISGDQFVRHIQEDKLNLCPLCYKFHKHFISCRGHQTFTYISLSGKHLEEDSVREVVVEDKQYTVSVMKFGRAITLCVYKKSIVYLVNIEAKKPDYILQSYLIDLRNWNRCNFLTCRPDCGFFFIIMSENVVHFIAAYVPLLEKLKHFQKIISYQFSKIRYQLTTCAYPHKIEIKDNVYQDSIMPTLCTEFNDGVAVLAMNNNIKFGLAPNWSLAFYLYEGKFIRKSYLKRSRKGELVLQNPVCMMSTLNNTLLICDSSELDKLVFEVDVDGNIVSRVNLKGKLSESITAVTTDGEGNIYVSGAQEVVQISEKGQKIREMLSIKNNMEYGFIVDICFSKNAEKLYVLMELEGNFTLVSFRFVAIP